MTKVRKQNLELTWIGKENRPKLEPRILREEPERSYHAKHWISIGDNECHYLKVMCNEVFGRKSFDWRLY